MPEKIPANPEKISPKNPATGAGATADRAEIFDENGNPIPPPDGENPLPAGDPGPSGDGEKIRPGEPAEPGILKKIVDFLRGGPGDDPGARSVPAGIRG